MAATEAKEVPPKVVEENSEPLNCKKWVLKVSIHCEGCKRKVKKVLHSVEGVYETDIDLKQQKAIVTVKGNVHPETLIRKLVKTGRPAELWPEKAGSSKEKKQSKSKNKKEKQSDQESSEESNHGEDKEKEAVKAEVHHVQDPSKHCEGGCPSKNNGEVTSKASGQVKEQKPEVKQTATSPAGGQSPVAEKITIGCENENGAEKSGGCGSSSGSGSGGKKKKKKGQKVSVKIDEGVEHPGDAPPSTGSSIHAHAQAPHGHGHGQISYPANHSSPPQHGYHQNSPQQYYSQPQHYYSAPPVYATSYNMAHPTSIHGTSYYASPPPPNSHVYMTEYETDHPPPSNYYSDSYPQHPSDSFELFSDENPNGCSIM